MSRDDDSVIGNRCIDSLPSIVRPDYHRAVLEFWDASAAEVASLSDLSSSLAGRDSLPDDRDRIAIVLHHVVLPKLADCGVLEYDARTNTARYRGHPQVEQVLRAAAPDV